MKSFECTRCRSTELSERAGYLVCAYCQSKYAPDVRRVETTIALASDVEVLLRKCVDDPSNRWRYANLVLDIDPTNQEATRFLR